MNASAKPAERVLKSLLAVVLAVSLCPLMPAKEAQAQENREGGNEMSASSASVDGANAQSNDSDDAAAPQSGESGDPIVDWTTSGTARWMIDASGCLVIAPLEGEESGELENWRWFDKAPWHDNSSLIISAKIEGAIAIPTATGMFRDCSSLRSLDLSGLDASRVTDMSSMFWSCSSLKSLDLSGLDASSTTDVTGMFSDCSSLKSLDLPSFVASKVTDMSNMFYNCSSLSSLDLSPLDTSSAMDMSRMFSGCSSLESLDLSSFDTSKVTGMSSMFSGCSSLESLDVSGWDTSQVTSMSSMFEGCSSLASLDLSPLDTSRVTDMFFMFCNCWSLESLDLSSFDTSRVTSMSNMFYGCSGLRTVVLGAAFSFRNYSYLPTPQGENLTGKWLSSADGKAYAPEAVPNNVAATYAAQTKADISDAVISGIPTKMMATGSQLTPKPVVTFNGERLVEGRDRDYIVSYGANVEPGVGAGSVTVSAAKRGNFTGSVTVYFDIETKIVFPDVDYDNDWFAPAVTFVSSRGLITGYADSGEFGPLDTLTRGQLATILWRNACPDEAASYDASEAVNETGLSGVDDHEYYTAAANWAVREGIITGFEREDGTYDFAASSPVSFEQLITILSRLGATSDEVAAAGDDLSEFLDGDNASPWSRSPIAWAAEKGLVGGYENEDGTRTLAPGEDVSRGRAATVLMRAFDLGIMG